MVNALGQVNASGGTPIRNKENECRGDMVFECHSRKATPEEMERYFGADSKKDEPVKPASEPLKTKTISKDELLERLHPTPKEPEPKKPEPEPGPEPEPEPEPDEPEPLVLDGIVAAARKVDERKYKSMKAAVIAIGLANGWE